jgi:hypothetical protein
MEAKYKQGGVFVLGLIIIGVIDGIVYNAGYQTLATAFWVIGYGTVIVGAWIVFFNPLDWNNPDSEDINVWRDGDENQPDSESESGTTETESPDDPPESYRL